MVSTAIAVVTKRSRPQGREAPPLLGSFHTVGDGYLSYLPKALLNVFGDVPYFYISLDDCGDNFVVRADGQSDIVYFLKGGSETPIPAFANMTAVIVRRVLAAHEWQVQRMGHEGANCDVQKVTGAAL